MISALLTGKNFPVLAMLAPRKNPKEPVPQVLAVMRLATADINPETILEFLQRFALMCLLIVF